MGTALGVLGAAAVGCAGPADRVAAGPGSTDPDEDEALAAATARQAAELVAAYRATTRRHPQLRPRLTALATHHERHLRVLGGDAVGADPGRRAPASVRSALARLSRSESALRRRRASAAGRAESGDLARVLASVAACQAQHLVLLGGPGPILVAAPADAAPSGDPSPVTVASAQDVLAGEHAAVYAYGVVGGVLDPAGSAAERARSAYEAHVTRRDRIEDRLRGLGEEPVAAEPGYALPEQVTDAGDAARLARRVEDRCGVLHAALVAASIGDLRAAAVGWLSDCATRGLTWGAAPVALPGIT